MTPNNEKQARFPRGAEVIPNRFGTAPGFAVRIGRGRGGVPPGRSGRVPGPLRGVAAPARSRRGSARSPPRGCVKLFGVPESHADHAMRPGDGRPGERRASASAIRAHWPEVHVKWSVPGPGRRGARRRASHAAVRAIFGDAVFGEGKEELPELVVARLAARGRARRARRELHRRAARGARHPRAGGVGGVRPRRRRLRERDEGGGASACPAALLAAHGAVSEPVARALAEGARRAGRRDLGHRDHRHRGAHRRHAGEAGRDRPPRARRARRHARRPARSTAATASGSGRPPRTRRSTCCGSRCVERQYRSLSAGLRPASGQERVPGPRPEVEAPHRPASSERRLRRRGVERGLVAEQLDERSQGTIRQRSP